MPVAHQGFDHSAITSKAADGQTREKLHYKMAVSAAALQRLQQNTQRYVSEVEARSHSAMQYRSDWQDTCGTFQVE